MKNPWKDLKPYFDSKELVLQGEKKAIEEFNSLVNDDYKIHTEIMPAPFMGNVHDASVVVLMTNPGYDPKEEDREFYSKYKKHWQNQVLHKSPIANLPLFCLDEQYCEYSLYWKDKLKPLITVAGLNAVANHLCVIQLFPYHSWRYKPVYKRVLKKENFENYLPSQEYNFHLVKEAINRNALLIIPRAVKEWEKAIPELKTYENRYSTNSYGNITLSEKNLGEGFKKVIEVLKGKS